MINMGNTYRYRVLYFVFLAFHTKWVLHLRWVRHPLAGSLSGDTRSLLSLPVRCTSHELDWFLRSLVFLWWFSLVATGRGWRWCCACSAWTSCALLLRSSTCVVLCFFYGYCPPWPGAWAPCCVVFLFSGWCRGRLSWPQQRLEYLRQPPAVQVQTWAAELVFWDRTLCSLSWPSHVDNLRAVSYSLPRFTYWVILCNLLVLYTWVWLHYCGRIYLLDDDSGVVRRRGSLDFSVLLILAINIYLCLVISLFVEADYLC
jgi:hypothetical protein